MKKEVDEKYLKQIFSNVVRAIVIVFYFLILNVLYENIDNTYFGIGAKILTMVFLAISVIIFEIAYKRDNDDMALLGIEVLLLSIYTMTTDYIVKKYGFEFKKYTYAASYVYAIYFVFKSMFIYTKGRKKIVDSFSDVREIVKKDEPIVKEATKKEIKEETDIPIKKTTTKKSATSTEKKITARKTTTTEKKSETKKTTTKKETPVKKSTTTAKKTTAAKTTTKKEPDKKKTATTVKKSATKEPAKKTTTTKKAAGTTKKTTTKAKSTRKTTTTKK